MPNSQLRRVCLAISIFTCCYSTSANGQIERSIFIIDAVSKVPVQDAVVQARSSIIKFNADENGYVSLRNVSPTSDSIYISCVGYKSVGISLSHLLFSDGKAIVQLEQRITSLNEVNISAAASKGIFKTISDLDIHLRPINNSQEVLRMVPGLFIGQHAGGGKAEQIFLRGFDLDHGTDINITVDGMPVNLVSHAHGQGYADLHFVIPELIDKVNFNKGPYFADKGNFTTAGFVEFKTKDYLENNFVKLEGGQFSSLRGIAGINLLKHQKERRTQSFFIAGEGSFTKGYFESPQNFSRYNALLKYHGNISNQSTLTATATAFTSKWNASGQIPDRAVKSGMVGYYGAIDNTEGGHTSRYNMNVLLSTRLNNGAVLRNQLFYSRYAFELFSNFTFFKEDSLNGDQIRQKENRQIAGYNGSYQKGHAVFGMKTERTVGLQVRYDVVDSIELTRTKNRVSNLKSIMLGNVRELNAGLYWQERVTINSKLAITAALRGDYFYNQYEDLLLAQTSASNTVLLSPKLNFNYRLSDAVQLYWYNGRGFHSNDTRVAVQQNGRKVLPPAYGSDFGAIVKLGKKIVLQSAVWYLWLDQEFVYVGDEGVVEAGGQTNRAGLDFSIRYELVKHLFADVDLSIANPRAIGIPAGENYLPLAPRFSSVGGLIYRTTKGWNGSVRYRYMADRPANENYTVIAKGYFVTDAAVNYSHPKWEAGLSVQNVLNTKWKETQFDTESRLQGEAAPVSEIHFTAGTPFFARLNLTVYF